MSHSSFFGTLTGGIQDISGLLPIIGTEQCETHIGSALEGGYLYAAATPLSIFGSLGVVKAGIVVLIASISVPIPSLSFTPFPNTSLKRSQRRWLGARLLTNAGFKPVGTVAPLISMDPEKAKSGDRRFNAERRFEEILEHKHIENPENLSVTWTAGRWIISLILSTFLSGALSIIPYIEIILRSSRDSIPLPWLFPIIRALGSCIAATSIQLIVQYRVIYLMKRRLAFLQIDRLHHNKLVSEQDLKGSDSQVIWSEKLPAEECLASLTGYLYTQALVKFNAGDVGENSSTQVPFSGEEVRHIHSILRYHSHPTLYSILLGFSWLFLLAAIPATVVGYVGCFSLVNRSSSPLTWLGLEVALSILRILLWAWDPKFDETTEVTIQMSLDNSPMVLSGKNADFIDPAYCVLDLMPEHYFLEKITPYKGPLEKFHSSNKNTALYFTFARDARAEFLWGVSQARGSLIMTVLNLDDHTAFTLLPGDEKNNLMYFDAIVTPNTNTGQMQAQLWLEIGKDHPRRKNHTTCHQQLHAYYLSLVCTLNNSSNSFFLLQKWSLSPKPTQPDGQSQGEVVPLSRLNQLYLQCKHEYHLKSELMVTWGEWIYTGMKAVYTDAQNDFFAITCPTSTEAEWGLVQLYSQLVLEWTKRELILLQLSSQIEDHISIQMKKFIKKVKTSHSNKQRSRWLLLEVAMAQKKRLEHECQQANVRMQEARMEMVDHFNGEKQPFIVSWLDNAWEVGQEFIMEKWKKVIHQAAAIPDGENIMIALMDSAFELEKLMEEQKNKQRFDGQWHYWTHFTYWDSQHHNEQQHMERTIEQIRNAEPQQLNAAYYYPKPSKKLVCVVYSRFAALSCLNKWEQELAAKLSYATVYDLAHCDSYIINDVLQKSSTCSVVHVGKNLLPLIPANNQLLYIHSVMDTETHVSPTVEQNQEAWWNQQTTNSWKFYFSPDNVDTGGRYVFSRKGTIAHIMIFINTPVYIQLHLLHCQPSFAFAVTSISIQEAGTELGHIQSNAVSENLRLQTFNSNQPLSRGRHDLELVIDGWYGLRDIMVNFVDNIPMSNNVAKGKKGAEISGMK